ncbi:MAG: hypothetical protein QOI66_26, partial [Myxococcales bacterium]|nr:hypothetical protein [Myxococcales bacterium]
MGKNHTVKNGECATSIAADNGFASVKDLFNHPDNAALRKLRPNPNLLAAGDVIVIPDHKPKTLALKADAKHKIVVTRPKAELHVHLRDLVGKKLKNAPFKLTHGAATVSGVSDGQGLIKVAIPPGLTSAQLDVQLPEPPPPPAPKSDGLVLPTETFIVPTTSKDPKKDYQPPKTLVWTLSIGSLGPAQVTTGAQRR